MITFEEDWQTLRANEVLSGQQEWAIRTGLFFIKEIR